jgi:biotin transport system substrate-specific component
MYGELIKVLDKYRYYRLLFYKGVYTAAIIKKICLSLAFAGLTGLCARIYIPLPFTPVPITGQTFAVLLSGTLLGYIWGPVSMLFYLIFGILGIPIYAGGKAGIGVLLGPTGGYLIGFIFAALLVGYYSTRYLRMRHWKLQLLLMLAASFIIYLFGSLGLFIFFSQVEENKNILHLIGLVITKGVLPFLLGDAIKAVAASFCAYSLLPKEAYNGELDK